MAFRSVLFESDAARFEGRRETTLRCESDVFVKSQLTTYADLESCGALVFEAVREECEGSTSSIEPRRKWT